MDYCRCHPIKVTWPGERLPIPKEPTPLLEAAAKAKTLNEFLEMISSYVGSTTDNSIHAEYMSKYYEKLKDAKVFSALYINDDYHSDLQWIEYDMRRYLDDNPTDLEFWDRSIRYWLKKINGEEWTNLFYEWSKTSFEKYARKHWKELRDSLKESIL